MVGFYKKHPKFDTTRLYKNRGKMMYKNRGKEMRAQGLLSSKSVRKFPKIKYLNYKRIRSTFDQIFKIKRFF